jgi:hypothetical protein
MLSENICSAELFDLQCIDSLMKSAIEALAAEEDECLLSVVDIVDAVKFQCEVYIHGALNDGLKKFV